MANARTKSLESVIYQEHRPTASDYDEAIELLNLAQMQTQPDGSPCSVCEDSDHQAWECHHNPLAMARKAVELSCSWQCFHCGRWFVKWDDAQEHFGESEDTLAACLTGARDA